MSGTQDQATIWHRTGISSSKLSTEYYNLGTFHRTITTTSADAQIWFDRGLIWAYAFNHQESSRCFEKAILADPKCAMAYWGKAFSLGPNYNKPWKLFDGEDLSATTARAYGAIEEAKRFAHPETPVEQALIEALRYRYPQKDPIEDCTVWNKKYAEAMESVYKAFPHDLDVIALYCDALMNLTPWSMWDLKTGEPSPGARTLEVKEALSNALSREDALQHPGLLHLMEMSPTPEKALPIADNLRGLVPDAGHLEHMPTHLDILCGDYRRAIASNTDAIRADEKFLAQQELGHFYNLYRAHDYHFRMYAAMLGGQSKTALNTAKQLAAAITEDMLRVKSPPLADWLEGFIAMQVHPLIRFGRWDDIIALDLPVDQDLYCVTTAMIHYAKGIAFAVKGQIVEAEEQKDHFLAAAKFLVPDSRTIFNNSCLDILTIADLMLRGELEYRTGNYVQAFDYLRDAVRHDDNLPYDEPWGWMQPTRHALGALLLEQGQVEEAVEVYAADLGIDQSLPRALRHPNNVWALHGYHECLSRLERVAEARIIEPQLTLALAMADVHIQSSCFCRLQCL